MADWGLPSPPGPLLWLGAEDAPFASEADFSGYSITRLTANQWLALPSSDDQVFTWLYVHGDALPDTPLNTLDRLERCAAPDGVLVMELPRLLAEDGLSALRTSSLAALLANLGWVPSVIVGERAGPSGVLAFRKQGIPSRYRLSTPTAADTEECQALFQRAFQEPVKPGLWEWKYGEGRAVSVIARRGQELVAHYGCASRAIRFLGQAACAVQICDVMVDPAERAVMTKTGAFFNAAKASQESIIGYGDRHLFGYGFPNHRHMRLGQRAGLYEEVERLVELRWTPRHGTSSLRFMLRPVQAVKAYERQIDRLWAAMAADLADRIVGVRDAAYLHYRYESHPAHVYHLFLLRHRWTRQALGLLVLRREGDCCRLIDLVGPLRCMTLMVEYARRIAADWGVTTLLAWITAGQARWLATGDEDMAATDIYIPGNCYIERVPVTELKNRWWLMMGDTDFL